MGCSNSKNTKAKEPEVEELEEPEDVPEVECEAEASAEVAVDAPEEATVEATEVETVTEAEQNLDHVTMVPNNTFRFLTVLLTYTE